MLSALALAQAVLLFSLDIASIALNVTACGGAVEFQFGTVSYSAVKKVAIGLVFAVFLLAAYLDATWLALIRFSHAAGGGAVCSTAKWIVAAVLLLLPTIAAGLAVLGLGALAFEPILQRALPPAAIQALARNNLTYVPIWSQGTNGLVLPIIATCTCTACVRSCSSLLPGDGAEMHSPLCLLQLQPQTPLQEQYYEHTHGVAGLAYFILGANMGWAVTAMAFLLVRKGLAVQQQNAPLLLQLV